MVMTPNFAKWNFISICDWTHRVSQSLHFVQLPSCFSPLERQEGVSAGECSPSMWQACVGLLISLPHSLQLLASEQSPPLDMFRTREKRLSIWSSEAFASDCFLKWGGGSRKTAGGLEGSHPAPREVWVLNPFLHLSCGALAKGAVETAESPSNQLVFLILWEKNCRQVCQSFKTPCPSLLNVPELRKQFSAAAFPRLWHQGQNLNSAFIC